MQKCKLPKNHKQYYFINKDGNQLYPNFFNDIFSILTKKKPIRKTEFIVGGVTICPNKQSEEQDKLFIKEQRSYLRKFKTLCKDNNINFSVEEKGGGYHMCDFETPRKTVCDNVGENFDTWYFDEWQELYYQLKTDLEGEE
jgi:hypothetical protein